MSKIHAKYRFKNVPCCWANLYGDSCYCDFINDLKKKCEDEDSMKKKYKQKDIYVKQYADRNCIDLDEAGGYYCRHIMAMTKEGLHDKTDIACELAWRDKRIDRLEAEINHLKTIGTYLV